MLKLYTIPTIVTITTVMTTITTIASATTTTTATLSATVIMIVNEEKVSIVAIIPLTCHPLSLCIPTENALKEQEHITKKKKGFRFWFIFAINTIMTKNGNTCLVYKVS